MRLRMSVFVSCLAGVAFAVGAYGAPLEGTAVPKKVVKGRTDDQHDAARQVGVANPKQIVFGDTHVHTTYSVDAYLSALPIMRAYNEGGYPVNDACDFARYCSALDYFVLTDHAEGYTARNWKEAKDAIRECNAISGDPSNPDLVAYMGYEWTQAGATPEEHFGHKNILFLGTADDELPARPIAAGGAALQTIRGSASARIGMMGGIDRENAAFYQEFAKFASDMRGTPDCAEGVSSQDLPADCLEIALTPGELFEKLDQWGFDTIVIPHGSAWGFYTPPGADFQRHLRPDAYDSDKQLLIEIYSGHGNSERYRDFEAVSYDENGKAYCPEPTADYLPTCWQAGEIIRKRCLALGEEPEECESRAVATRENFVADISIASHLTVAGAGVKDWLDAGQGRNMFQPAFNYRPKESVQYSMAIGRFDDPNNPLRHRWGFIASSDNHRARPGTGYKEYNRRQWTEGGGVKSEKWATLTNTETYPLPWPVKLEKALQKVSGFGRLELERQASFFVTGGLAAVHSEGRNREAIWDGMKRKEVYGTSGPRLLLWFDMLNGPGEAGVPMGGDVKMAQAPQFRARAVGSFKQLPGCPEYSVNTLSPERLQDLCAGECYNPSDERRLISRIEVIRIRPQANPNEDVGTLIEDPWKILECEANPDGCVVEFDDPDYVSAGRDTVYYVRAIEEPSPAVNGANLRTRYDGRGNAISVEPCFGDYRSEFDDDCLSDVEQRAWSSPIFVDWAGN